jgi:hypothetical protein
VVILNLEDIIFESADMNNIDRGIGYKISILSIELPRLIENIVERNTIITDSMKEAIIISSKLNFLRRSLQTM